MIANKKIFDYQAKHIAYCRKQILQNPQHLNNKGKYTYINNTPVC